MRLVLFVYFLRDEDVRMSVPSLSRNVERFVRTRLSYLLSASTLILAMTVGLSVVAGELMPGLSTGRMNTGGLACSLSSSSQRLRCS